MFSFYLGGGCGKSSVVGKVVELSRKNRSLSAELISEQNKIKQLEDKLKSLVCEEFQQSNAPLVSTGSSLSSSTCDDKGAKVCCLYYVLQLLCVLEQQTIILLGDRLKEALAKSAEHRNQCEILKQELKVALKVLVIVSKHYCK